MLRVPTLLTLLLALLLLAGPAQATNGPNLNVLGAKGPLDMPAFGDPFDAMRLPSAVGWSLENRIDLSLFGYQTVTTLRNRLNDFEGSSFSPGAAFAAVLAPGRPEADDDEAWEEYSDAKQFTLFMGIYPELVGAAGRNLVRYETFPNGVAKGTGLSFISFSFGGAFTPTEWLSLGLSIQFIYSSLEIRTLVGADAGTGGLGGSPTLNGVPFPGNPTYADFLDLFSSDELSDPTTVFVGDLLTIQFSAILSFSITPRDDLAFGFSWRPRSFAPLPFTGEAEVRADATLNSAVGGLPSQVQTLFFDPLPNKGQLGFVSNYDTEVEDVYVPQQVRLSVAWWPLVNLLVGAEIGWTEWHAAFDVSQATLTKGSNPDLNYIIGSDRLTTQIESKWRNSWVWTAQVAWGVTDYLTLRTAFTYANSPINSSREANSSNAGYVEETLFLGAGYRLTENLELNVLYEHGFYNGEDSEGRPAEPTAKFSRYSAKQYAFHLGISLIF